jgi:hypothetical protein
VGLQEVQEVAPGGAALGNSMALVDAGGDLLILAGEEVEENDWTRFAINLLGLYQGPASFPHRPGRRDGLLRTR